MDIEALLRAIVDAHSTDSGQLPVLVQQAAEQLDALALQRTQLNEAVQATAQAIGNDAKKKAKKVKPPSRAKRWADACSEARAVYDEIDGKKAELEAAFSTLNDLKQEYQDWLDNLDGKFSGSPLVEKLEAVTQLDFDQELDISDIENVISEAENADLPQGFGRD